MSQVELMFFVRDITKNDLLMFEGLLKSNQTVFFERGGNMILLKKDLRFDEKIIGFLDWPSCSFFNAVKFKREQFELKAILKPQQEILLIFTGELKKC